MHVIYQMLILVSMFLILKNHNSSYLKHAVVNKLSHCSEYFSALCHKLILFIFLCVCDLFVLCYMYWPLKENNLIKNDFPFHS